MQICEIPKMIVLKSSHFCDCFKKKKQPLLTLKYNKWKESSNYPAFPIPNVLQGN